MANKLLFASDKYEVTTNKENYYNQHILNSQTVLIDYQVINETLSAL